VKDENGDLLADSDNIFNRWKNYSQLLNVRIRQIEIHTAESLVHGLILLRLKLLLQNWKKCKLPGSDQISAESIQAGGETLLWFTNSLILFGLRKNCLISGRSLLFYQSTKSVIKLTAIIMLSLLSTSYKILSNIILSRLLSYIYEVTGDHQCGLRLNRSTTDQIFCIL
jgi:hypothetical protein